jgi:hypothetical protein
MCREPPGDGKRTLSGQVELSARNDDGAAAHFDPLEAFGAPDSHRV